MAGHIILKVDGMICDFCAQSLEKVFLKQNGILNLDISLHHKTVTLEIDSALMLSDDKLKKLVEWGGYDLVDIQRIGN